MQAPAFALSQRSAVTVHREAFGQTKAIKLMAIITSMCWSLPVIGPLSGVPR
ncbi:hypothetical protein KCP75_24100 [Salmonella enterica subsp. enterica]|nr:hypothetical protein KCP75_24100 [Salmonella enterica subsp. enterica]